MDGQEHSILLNLTHDSSAWHTDCTRFSLEYQPSYWAGGAIAKQHKLKGKKVK
jgi:hypothetical protein